MKIISKHKDYYDYLQGIYGIDEIMVYDRRTKNLIRETYLSSGSAQMLTLAICNRIYCVYAYKKKLYHTPDELVELDHKLTKDGERSILPGYGKWSYRSLETEQDAAKRHFEDHNHPTDVNKRLRRPVLIRVHDGEFKLTDVRLNRAGYYGSAWYDSADKDTTRWAVPLLKDFNFPKWYLILNSYTHTFIHTYIYVCQPLLTIQTVYQ